MIGESECEYSARREKAERLASVRASDLASRRIHEILADRYAEIVRSGVTRDEQAR